MSEVVFTNRLLSMSEASSFVNLAVNICFDKDGKIIPFMRYIGIEYAALAFYSNYNPLEHDITEVYEVIYQAREDYIKFRESQENCSQFRDLVDVICDTINTKDYESSKEYTFSQALMDWFQGKSSPVIAGLIEAVANAFTDNETVGTKEDDSDSTETADVIVEE